MYFVGVDSGGTKTSFVLANQNGQILARHLSGSGWGPTDPPSDAQPGPVDNFLGYNAESGPHGEFVLDRGSEPADRA